MEKEALTFDPNDIRSAYLAPEGLEKILIAGVDRVLAVYDRLILSGSPAAENPWAQNIWRSPRVAAIQSIKDATTILRGIQRSWFPYSFQLHRRTALIQDGLPKVTVPLLVFPVVLPVEPLGSFTLLNTNLMLFSESCSAPVPNGEYTFQEDKRGPPNRAYLKVWEALTRAGQWPGKKDVCLELGASPGGWTYVLAGLAGKVIAIDRSPLDSSMQKFKNIEFQTGNAFAATPEKYPEVSWLFSDVICYPDKLYDFVVDWSSKAPQCKMICTLKFQGTEHYPWIEKFAALPASKILHLFHNKHELTWMRL
ncbi:MAG: SAM-dependent methyltransferase [Oligoflexales bacterium]